MDPQHKNSKQWKTKSIHNTYQDANEIKNLLLDNDDTGELEVKISRSGPGGIRFKVRTYFPAPPKKEVKSVKKKTNKDRKNSHN